MKKFRTYKKYSLVYSLDKEEGVYRISIEKSTETGIEQSCYYVNGVEKELKALLCRLWSCGVTPMSLVYILEDEGYIPQTLLCDDDAKNNSGIVRRNFSCKGEVLKSVLTQSDNDTKSFAAVGFIESDV